MFYHQSVERALKFIDWFSEKPWRLNALFFGTLAYGFFFK